MPCPPNFNRATQEALQLKGLSERTQESYLRSVRQLFDFAQCEPEALTEAQLRSYYLHRRNVSRWAPNTLRISYFAIQFFFTHVLIRPWPTLKLLNAKQPHSLPAVLSTAEVRAILACVHRDGYRVFLTVVYSCGLRLQEAQYLAVSDIDAPRGLIRVHWRAQLPRTCESDALVYTGGNSGEFSRIPGVQKPCRRLTLQQSGH